MRISWSLVRRGILQSGVLGCQVYLGGDRPSGPADSQGSVSDSRQSALVCSAALFGPSTELAFRLCNRDSLKF